jgi:hypothetical protein
MMTPEQIRLKQNPILSNLLLGMGQGTYIAEKLFPRLPAALRGVTLAKVGKERMKRYNLRRAPGADTKRVDISYEGKVYTVSQYSVEVPIPREVMQEADEAKKLDVAKFLEPSKLAMTTANDILLLDYELEVATIATDTATYAAGNVLALAGGTKWSAATGTPVSDVAGAAEMIRRKVGKRPNTLTISAKVLLAVTLNAEVRSYLPSSQMGPATIEQLKVIFKVEEILVGDAVWVDEKEEGHDVWGNDAVLAYVPKISAGGSMSLAEPGFGFTNVLEGHPFAETPYYEASAKSWIYGATYERQANVGYNDAAFLFKNAA